MGATMSEAGASITVGTCRLLIDFGGYHSFFVRATIIRLVPFFFLWFDKSFPNKGSGLLIRKFEFLIQ